VITEIGGNGGDIECWRSWRRSGRVPVDFGRRRTMFIHLTLVPYIAMPRLKTSRRTPRQRAARIGIRPDM